MKILSKKEIALLISPILAGVCFIATVYLNHKLFKNQIISARQAIGHEMLFFFIGFVATFIQLVFSIKCLFQKQWKMVLLCVTSTVLFWFSIIFGRSQGAAMFFAT